MLGSPREACNLDLRMRQLGPRCGVAPSYLGLFSRARADQDSSSGQGGDRAVCSQLGTEQEVQLRFAPSWEEALPIPGGIARTAASQKSPRQWPAIPIL